MTIAEDFLTDFEAEMKNTRRVLERVPDDRLDFSPHPKSKSMAWLATHVANLPQWIALAMTRDGLDVAADDAPRPAPASSRAELLEKLEANVAAARNAVTGATDEAMHAPWTLRSAKGETIFTMPRINVLRSFCLHHHIHHRAQLTMYLRLTDVPLPPLYGPTADEAGF